MTAARAVPAGGQLVCVGGIGTVVETALLVGVGVAVFPGVGVTDPPVVVGPPQAARRSVRNISELIATKRRGREKYSCVFMICLLSSLDRRTIS